MKKIYISLFLVSIENLKTVKYDTFIFIICSKCKNEVEKNHLKKKNQLKYKKIPGLIKNI